MAATNPIIESVDFDEGASKTTIKINFILPVSQVSHFPLHSGKQLDVVIQTTALSPEEQGAILQPQRLGYKTAGGHPVEIIRYDPENPAGKVISILFAKNTAFSIAAQTNPRQLVIELEVAQQKNEPSEAAAPEPETRIPAHIEDSEEFKYTINLLSSKTSIPSPDVSRYPLLAPYFIYSTVVDIKQTSWNRVRLGFFKSKNDAIQALSKIQSDFPRAWIDRAKGDERKHIRPWLVNLAKGKNKLAFTKEPETDKKPGADLPLLATESQKLFASAKKDIIDGQYKTAIRTLTRLLGMPANESSEAAQELLGVAREKNRQIAHAIAEYRIYLRKYPKGEYFYRVKQRLNGLISAKRTSGRTLRRAKSSYRDTPLQIYGSVFQFYRRDANTTDPSNTIVSNSSLDTDVSLSARKRTKDYDLRSQFTGSYRLNTNDTTQSQFRISTLYADASDRKRSWNARVGRQSKSSGGVLGRFDGIDLGYQFSPKWKINAVAGLPVVISSTNQFQTDKQFFGMSLDMGTYAKYWNGTIFAIKQTAWSLDDRTAIGAELRYLNPKLTVFGLLDYDVDHSSINIAQLISNVRLPKETTLNIVADYRNSPILSTSNALQGQTAASLDILLLTYTEDQIKQLARDRTAIFRSVSTTLSKPVFKNLLLSLDFSASHLEGTPASGGIASTPSSGMEYFLGTQLVASNVFKNGDTTLAGVRYANTSSSDTYTFSLNSRYPISKNMRINPRIRIDSQSRSNGSEILTYRPSLRADYRAKRNFKIEMEGGYEYSDISDFVGKRTESNYFINIGYIYDF